MSQSRLKAIYYTLTAVNALATSYYFNYLFFFLRDRFGFGDRENLAMGALHGVIYIVSAWQGGTFAHRYGAYRSLAIGFGGLFLCMTAGAYASSPLAQVLVLAAYSVALLFVWPALASLVAEGEPRGRVPHMVGVYNCTWASASAVAYFTGGALYGWLGPVAVFTIPSAVFLAELGVVFWLARANPATGWRPTSSRTSSSPRLDGHSIATRTAFLRLAWIANPFAYVAMYTVFAVMPSLADTLGLSSARAGLVCSVWLFARLFAFVGLWQWEGWHYRFRWLGTSYVAMTASFAAMLLVASLPVVIAAQIVFGLACGLIYYSSLYYSMDVGEADAKHGGMHEAAIGAGIFTGPAVAAVSLHVFPAMASGSVYAVTGLLTAGLLTVVAVWRRSCRRP